MTSTGNRFGGERLESKSQLSHNNLLEHLARYELVPGEANAVVLDLGCGAGHGSHMLAKKFKKVYGIDLSSDAIAYAKEHWQLPNIEFKEGSGTAIPFPNATFDTVVAYEVFEHICDWQTLLREVRRVLKPQGLFYVSTPNKTLYSPGTKKPINPHHCFEMTEPEFKDALKGFFSIKQFFGQRTPVYNDHFIWKIVNPILFTFKRIVPYRVNNTLKLKIINWIKPNLDPTDIVFSDDPSWVSRARFMIAVCVHDK